MTQLLWTTEGFGPWCYATSWCSARSWWLRHLTSHKAVLALQCFINLYYYYYYY